MTAKIKNQIKNCPFLALLVSTGILFSLTGLCGKKNVYAGQEYDPLKEPALVMMFKGLRENIYPWQIFDRESTQVMASNNDNENISAGVFKEEEEAEETEGIDDDIQTAEEAVIDDKAINGEKKELAETDLEEADKEDTNNDSGEEDAGEEDSDGGAFGGEVANNENEENVALEPLMPLRESTREEYLNHISADIYGDAGVKRAAEYEFSQVDESYFDDALFIGDSRTVGLRDYTDLSERADFYCETSLTIQKMLEENFPGQGTIEEALASKEYGKIYIMLGINELGVGTTEDFMEKYTEAITFLREKEPEAKIFIQGIMRVTGKKNSTDAIFNNSNINARNNAIATLADNKHVFYIDVNEVVCDEEGNLNTEYTFDQLHLLGVYNDIWKQFLLSHGVTEENQE